MIVNAQNRYATITMFLRCKKMSTIHCKAQLVKIGSWTLLELPKSASEKFPSRGMCMAEGTLNGKHFQIPLEPDGKGSHWFNFDKAMQKATGSKTGDTLTLEIKPAEEWPEPEIPADLKKALADDPRAQELWLDVTTKSRWDWIRWIRSTKNPETRKIRIEKTFSKLKSGKRSPCCFNRSACTEPSVSHNGVLLEPMQKN